MTGYGRNRIEEERNIVMLKKLLLPVVLALAVAGYPAPSHASCTQVGTIVFISVDAGAGSPVHQIQLKTGALSDVHWAANTIDDDTINAAIGFMMGQKQVRLNGDAASCPTSSNFRLMGNIAPFASNPGLITR